MARPPALRSDGQHPVVQPVPSGPAAFHAVFLLREPRVCTTRLWRKPRPSDRSRRTHRDLPNITARRATTWRKACCSLTRSRSARRSHRPIRGSSPVCGATGRTSGTCGPTARTSSTSSQDARDQVLTVGVQWLELLADVAVARQHFAEVPSTNHAPGIVAEGYEGALGSPARERAVDALDQLLARLRS